MANIKTYSIQINGIQESVKAVDALSASLDNLEKKIKSLENKTVNIGSKVSGGESKSSSTGALSEEAKLEKQIVQLEEKRIAHSKEIYQNYLAAKDVLKEIDNDQKSIAATERLQAKTYSNTIAGMKQELADIKSAMQTVDLGDTDQLDKMTQRAKELNDSLKKIEESYGQFGRNVGNYAEGVAEGLSKVKINVGGTVREFDNAKQAAKELGNELKTMAVNGQQGTKEFKDLQKAVAALNSDIKDATVSSKAMDNLLDTMQSIASIGSITKGFSALFGFDDTEIEKSIQKLVALQNVMQGIEKINQQMNTGEGIGGWLSKGNAAIDSLVEKLTGANKAQVALNASTTAGKTASEGLAAAETAQAAATTTATVATKALSVALKAIGIGLVISAIATLITYWKDIYNWFTETIPALKNLSTWFDKIRAVAVGVGTAIANYLVQPIATLAKVIMAVINGNFSEIPKIIAEGLDKTFNVVKNFQKGYYKETERQQEVHNKKMADEQKKANEELLKDEEAKYGSSHKRTQEYLKKQMALTKKGSDEYKELQRKLWEDEREEREEKNKKSISDAKKYNKELTEAEQDLNQLRIANMKEGLNKVIKQLEEERKQKLAKVEADGKLVGERQAEINKYYDKKIEDAKKEHAKNIENTYRTLWDRIHSLSIEGQRKIVDIMNQATEIGRRKLEDSTGKFFNQGMSSYGVQGKNQLSKGTRIELQFVSTGEDEFTEAMKKSIDMMREAQIAQNAYGAAVEKFSAVEKKATEVEKGYWNLALSKLEYTSKEKTKLYDEERKQLVEKYGEEKVATFERLLLEENYTSSISTIYNQRYTALENYWEKRIAFEKSAATENYKAQVQLENEQFEVEKEQLQRKAEEVAEINKNAYEKEEITTEQYNENVKKNAENFNKLYDSLVEQHNNNLIQLENKKNDEIKQINGEAYNARLQELRDFQTAVSNLESKQQVYNAFGIINLSETKKNNENLLKSYETLANQIVGLKRQLQAQLDANEITFDDFQNANRELDAFAENVGQKMDKVKNDLKLGNQIASWIQSAQMYLQELENSFNTIMGAIWDAQEVAFDKEQEEIDKDNERLQNALDEKKDLISKYKSEIDSIEDELANSRGDRRQHLIDQLNAEMAAEREAAKQKKKIEEEQQRQQKKQDDLDLKRKKAEYHRNLTQAIVNGAMAVTMAAINSWPIPAIPMMALAGATTAAQIAIMASNKPYAKGGQLDGGVAQGPRHRDGGIPVLGGRASIEGGEFITNRLSTANNIDLLEFINSKKKKVDVSDLIDFYSSGNVKKNISGIRTKFEDGGYVQPLPNIDVFDDDLRQSFERYSNRPVVVSVVDINNKQADVKRVQTLAGL